MFNLLNLKGRRLIKQKAPMMVTILSVIEEVKIIVLLASQRKLRAPIFRILVYGVSSRSKKDKRSKIDHK
jgi:hypothetical protein